MAAGFLLCMAGKGSVKAATPTPVPSAAAEPQVTKTPVETKAPEDEIGRKGYITEDELDKVRFEFDETETAVIVGDKVVLDYNINVPDGCVEYSYEGYSGHAADIDKYDKDKSRVWLRGNYEGNTPVYFKATVTYCDEEGMIIGTKLYSAKVIVKVLPKLSADISAGDGIEVDYTEYKAYEKMKYEFEEIERYDESNTTDKIAFFQNGRIIGNVPGEVCVYLTDGSVKINIGNVYVRSNGMSISENLVTRAIGSAPYQLTVNNLQNKTVTWSSANTKIATVDANGYVTPVSEGKVDIKATIKNPTGKNVEFLCNFTVTNPKLSAEKIYVAKGFQICVNITGTTGKGVWKSKRSTIASVYSDYYETEADTAYITGQKKGTTTVSVEIDGVVKTIQVTVTTPKVNKEFILTSKGTRQIIKITGAGAGSKIRYTSRNSKVATVSKNGVIKSKRSGFSLVTVEVDGALLTVSVNVAPKKAVKAVLNALKAEGAVYSQARRMSKGYYDCSSLVWRSYKTVGAYFGDRHYAPVAANEALYCVRHKMSIRKKNINKLNKLQSGDLVFYSRGIRNGRYKNIYHVAIYMGQEGYAYGNTVYTSGKIIHADGVRVSQAPLYNQSNCVVIGRVFK